jgi:hypothetical protein
MYFLKPNDPSMWRHKKIKKEGFLKKVHFLNPRHLADSRAVRRKFWKDLKNISTISRALQRLVQETNTRARERERERDKR